MSKIVRKVVRPHDCDVAQFKPVIEQENLGTGTVFECKDCPQWWYLRRPQTDSWSFTPISRYEYYMSRLRLISIP